MFNRAINAFIQRYGGSRQRAGEAIGYSRQVMGLLLRCEMNIPLIKAFLIEAETEGDISVSQLIMYQDRALALAIERSVKRYLDRVI